MVNWFRRGDDGGLLWPGWLYVYYDADADDDDDDSADQESRVLGAAPDGRSAQEGASS